MRLGSLHVGFLSAVMLLTLVTDIAARVIYHQPGFGLEVPHHGKRVDGRNAQQAYFTEPENEYGYPPPYGPVTSATSSTEDVCESYSSTPLSFT